MENLFAHDPFREGKVEETLFDAASALLKHVLVNGHAVPASETEVNAEEGCVRVADEGGDHRVRQVLSGGGSHVLRQVLARVALSL